MLLLASGYPAHAMFQVSPVLTPGLTLTPTSDFGEPPSPVVATLAPPTSVPLPVQPIATATPKGFLPAPTIVNPNDLKSLPLAQPQVSGPGPNEDPARVPVPAANTGVRAVVALLNYLWMLCGALLLIGGAVAILLVWRRGERS